LESRGQRNGRRSKKNVRYERRNGEERREIATERVGKSVLEFFLTLSVGERTRPSAGNN
jgi:hypothetical protein